MGGTVQAGPSAGWRPLLRPAIQELSVARHLSCSVSGLARFSLPQAPSRPSLRLASSGHTRVTWAEHRYRTIQAWRPVEPTHPVPPLSPQEGRGNRAAPTRSGHIQQPSSQKLIVGHLALSSQAVWLPGLLGCATSSASWRCDLEDLLEVRHRLTHFGAPYKKLPPPGIEPGSHG